MVKEWETSAAYFDGVELAGLVPTIFSPDEEATRAAFKKDIMHLHGDINRINRSVFFIPESVYLKDASALLKKPR